MYTFIYLPTILSVDTYTQTDTHKHTHTQTDTHKQTHTHPYTHTNTHTHTHKQTHTHTYTHTGIKISLGSLCKHGQVEVDQLQVAGGGRVVVALQLQVELLGHDCHAHVNLHTHLRDSVLRQRKDINVG